MEVSQPVTATAQLNTLPTVLTQDVLIVLRDQGGPVLPLWLLDVDVYEAVPRGVQVGAEGENTSFVGDVRVLSLKVVHKFDPWEQTCRTRGDQGVL